MRTHPAALLMMAACLLASTACASAEDIASSQSSTSTSDPTPPIEPTDTGTPTSSPATPTAPSASTATLDPPTIPTAEPPTLDPPENDPRPVAGQCHDTGRAAFRTQRDSSPAIRCSQRHTTETFAVVAVGSTPSRAALNRARRACQPRFEAYVGSSSTVSTIGYTILLPDVEQAANGAGWLRCDAIELANYNSSGGLPRTGSVEGALAGAVPDEFRGCSKRWPKVDQPVHFTSCRASHQAELIPVSLTLGGPEAPFPGRSSAKARSKQFCLDNFQEWVPEAVNYYYYFPTRASWTAGSHETTCWALDVTGDELPPI